MDLTEQAMIVPRGQYRLHAEVTPGSPPIVGTERTLFTPLNWRRSIFNDEGVGMAMVVDASAANDVAALLTEAGETVYKLGALVPRTGEAVEIV